MKVVEEIDFSKLPKKERKRLKREMERKEQGKKEKTKTIVTWSIVTLLLLLVLLGGWWLYKEVSKPLPGQTVDDQGRQHVSREEWEKFAYNSNPPTSGPHDSEWKRGGVYSQPQGDGNLVHSLEHGYVVISHNCSKSITGGTGITSTTGEGTPAAEMDEDCLNFVEKLKERVNRDSYKLILAPRSNLETNFALTAWTRIDMFSTDQATIERVDRFIKAFRNKGPEKTME